MLKAMLERVAGWSKSAAGITVLASIFLALVAAVDRGPYVLVNTIVAGGMLALMAIGLALVFGVMNIPLFAHGEFFMIGTLVAYYVFTPISGYVQEHPSATLEVVAPLIGMLCAAVAGLAVGALIERLIFYELRKRSRANWVMNTFLLTLGLSVVLINGHQLVFGTEFKGITGYWSGMPLSVMGVYIARDRVMAFVIAVLLILGFWVFMKSTRTGRAIRAVAQDETGALMVGIGLNWIQTLTMALACALATVSGASLLFMYPSYPSVGLEPLYMAWFVVILVGLGNTLGALVGGFIVSLLKVLTVEYIGSGWDFVVPSALIILVLIFKPNGIFGSEVRGVHEA